MRIVKFFLPIYFFMCLFNFSAIKSFAASSNDFSTTISTDGTFYSGTIENDGEISQFSFKVIDGNIYKVETIGLSDETDVCIHLYSNDGTTEILKDDGGGRLTSEIDWEANFSGLAFISVEDLLGRKIVKYNISVTDITDYVISADEGNVKICGECTKDSDCKSGRCGSFPIAGSYARRCVPKDSDNYECDLLNPSKDDDNCFIQSIY